MNLSLQVHYKNKFPKCQVKATEESLDVYSRDGKHLVALRKNGAGQLVDHSKTLGCYEEHDLSALKKDGRCYKLFADNRIDMAEEYRERRDMVKAEIEKCEKKSDYESSLVVKRPWGDYMVKSEK